jgi:hypothetical protein
VNGEKLCHLSQPGSTKGAALQAIIDLIPQEFSGAVLVSQNGDTLFAEGFGFADRPNQVKNTMTAVRRRFWVC